MRTTHLRFTKMHGAGNDFVVLDLRGGLPAPDAALCRHLGDRHFGVGCDQIITIAEPRVSGSVASYGIWNSDGSASGQCGNGARCVAAWLRRDGAAVSDRFNIDSPVGTHEVEHLGGDQYAIAMGVPQFAPASIPLAGVDAASDRYLARIADRDITFGAISMGNPHAVIDVADLGVSDVDVADVAVMGPALQASPLFPESANIGFAQILAREHIRLRVYERGAGETLACGSGACAAAVVLMQRGVVDRAVNVDLPGGRLHIRWPDVASAVTMTGPAAFVFDGELATQEV